MTDNFYAPPHSIEAEQAVIGGLLLDDDSSERVQKVLAMLKPDSFYSRPHKIIFEEITRMHREQKPVDGLTLFDELERKSLTASVGGFAYIAEIAKNTPSAANIVAYAMQVRETAMERYAINRMTEATELLYLTLMTAEKADRNDLAYGMITKGLKNLAKELDCVVVLLTQLNRALESRTNKRPLPSDSRDTGQIEQDCDYWVGIHREGAFDDSVPPGETELILRLNRHGNTGTVYCIQANGAIYDTDQQSAEMRRREREEPQSKKKGGF